MKKSDPSANGAELIAEQRQGVGRRASIDGFRSGTERTIHTCWGRYVRGWGGALVALALLSVSGLVRALRRYLR